MTKKEIYKAIKEDILKNGDSEFHILELGSGFKLVTESQNINLNHDPISEEPIKSNQKNLNRTKDVKEQEAKKNQK